VTNPEVSTQQPLQDQNSLQVEVEEFLNEASLHGGVIIGRGANLVLRDTPGVLSVLLVGRRDERVRQAMERYGRDRRAAEHQLDVNDEARLATCAFTTAANPRSPPTTTWLSTAQQETSMTSWTSSFARVRHEDGGPARGDMSGDRRLPQHRHDARRRPAAA
jgi:hypothetical protein